MFVTILNQHAYNSHKLLFQEYALLGEANVTSRTVIPNAPNIKIGQKVHVDAAIVSLIDKEAVIKLTI